MNETYTTYTAITEHYYSLAEAIGDSEANGWTANFVESDHDTEIVQESPALFSWKCSCGQNSPDHYIGHTLAAASAIRHYDEKINKTYLPTSHYHNEMSI